MFAAPYFHEWPPPRPGNYEYSLVRWMVKLLKALSAAPPGAAIVAPKFPSTGWTACDELSILRLVDFFQKQTRKRGPFRWVVRLTPLGRQLVDELSK